MVQRRLPCHSADKDKTKAPISSRFPNPGDLSSRNVALSVNVSDERFKPQIKDLRSLSAPKPSQSTNSSSSCASSPFAASLMAKPQSTFDAAMDYKVLTMFAYRKMHCHPGSSWSPFDIKLLKSMCIALHQNGIDTINPVALYRRVLEWDNEVREYLKGGNQNMANKEMLLDVFENTTVFNPNPTPDHVSNSMSSEERQDGSPRANCNKRTSGYLEKDNDDSVMQHGSKRSCSDNVVDQLGMLLDRKEAMDEIMDGPLSIIKCTEKLQSCGFKKEALYEALDMLKTDLEMRGIFMAIHDLEEAQGYMMNVLFRDV